MPIRVVVSGNGVFVWNPKDVSRLRQEHRIVGALVGAHPRAPHQNANRSLPLKLMQEEVTLLRDKGLVALVDGTFNVEPPSDELRAEYAEYKTKQYEGQDLIFQREQEENRRKFETKIAEGSEKRRRRAEAKSAAAGAGVTNDDLIVRPMTEEYTMVQLFNEEPWRPSLTPATWSYPETAQEKLRYNVFRDLWEKGYFLTSGGKFGGDFLVYPGDPLLYHSSHIAICLLDVHRLDARQLVCMGRLGSNVRKTVLICSAQRSEQEKTIESENNSGLVEDVGNSYSNVHYLTLEWTGIS